MEVFKGEKCWFREHFKDRYSRFPRFRRYMGPTLIESMLEAFELGADFYFTNHYQLNSEVGAFEGGKLILLTTNRCKMDYTNTMV